MRQIEESKSQLGKDAMFIFCLYVILLVWWTIALSLVSWWTLSDIIFNTKMSSMKLQNKVPTRVTNKKINFKVRLLSCFCVGFFELYLFSRYQCREIRSFISIPLYFYATTPDYKIFLDFFPYISFFIVNTSLRSCFFVVATRPQLVESAKITFSSGIYASP